ncbi:IS607 family transposase [Geitlerinema sp. PCC 9228]|uniref:IS607 family transposase n=1 Tax=Geitlerinema sp. PCC 9228 TaxID=111611 RepID=UPI000A516CD8|nr:IS607 family transposase [Geitlerinema sp. PCC 9228]
MKYVPSRKASEILGLHPNTLRKYAKTGKINFIKNEAGQRLYDVESYAKQPTTARVICYCRVSSSKQQDDLLRQEQYLQEKFPQAEIIKDIGSGLNYKRKGLKTILQRCLQGDSIKLVLSHRDRLVRFGFELIEFIIESSGGEIVVLNSKDKSSETELTQDLLSVLHVFSCRMHGRRSYSKVKEDSYYPDDSPEGYIKALVRSLQIRLQQDSGVSQTTRDESKLERNQGRYSV